MLPEAMACCPSRSGSPEPNYDWVPSEASPLLGVGDSANMGMQDQTSTADMQSLLSETPPSSPVPFRLWSETEKSPSASFGQLPCTSCCIISTWPWPSTAQAPHYLRAEDWLEKVDVEEPSFSFSGHILHVGDSANTEMPDQTPTADMQWRLQLPAPMHSNGDAPTPPDRLRDTTTVEAFCDPQRCGELLTLVILCSKEDLARTLVSLKDDIRDMCRQFKTMCVDKRGKAKSADNKHDEAKSRIVQEVIKKGREEPVESKLGSQVQEIVHMFLVLPAAFHIHFHHILVAIFEYFPRGRLSKNIVDAFKGHLGEMARNGVACRVVNAMIKYQSEEAPASGVPDQPVNNLIKEELLKPGECGALAEHKNAHWPMQEIVLKGDRHHVDRLYWELKTRLPMAIVECRKNILYTVQFLLEHVQFLLEHAAGHHDSDWQKRLTGLGDDLKRLPATATCQALLLSGEGGRERELSLMADGECFEDFLSSNVLNSLEENDREHFKYVKSAQNRIKFAEHLKNITTALESPKNLQEQVLRWREDRREAERRGAERRGRQ